jgi:hypothetical protein
MSVICFLVGRNEIGERLSLACRDKVSFYEENAGAEG